jgi:hypothetical protein
MAGNEKDGYYCTICGGFPPDQVKIGRIPVYRKETGIDWYVVYPVVQVREGVRG